MIEPDKRKAVFALHTEGMTQGEISRRLRISRNTVRAIIRQDGRQPEIVRKDQKQIDPDLLQKLYQDCDGWVQRVHEKLAEEHGISVGYSTLTRMLRKQDWACRPRNAAIACRMSRGWKCSTTRPCTR